jgi:hypothetical protein
MKDQFKRVLELVKRTGDTMIVTDSDGENAYVVMDLDQYELFIDAPFTKGKDLDFDEKEVDFERDLPSEPELSPTIDRDLDEDNIPDIWDVMKSANDEGATWNTENLSHEELADLEKQYKDFAQRHIQEAVEENRGEDFQDKKKQDNDEFGEEQFYLEPID